MNELLQEAKAVGCEPRLSTFDGGQTLSMTHTASGVTWRGSFMWGDERRFIHRARKWLNTLPWPREDDPRVEGAY
jgi:hypothetical protein